MSIANLADDIVDWMNDYITNANLCCWVVGVSGGVDSAVVQRLCGLTPKKTIAIAMPMSLSGDSDPKSLEKATELCINRPNTTLYIREIGSILASYKHVLLGETQLSQGNLRSRIRANILYDFAGKYRGLVVGTGNLDEDSIGYFTKGGDGLVDLCPLSALHKSTVRQLAEYLDVPSSIINAKSTAGLWDGQTDEDELGMSYDEVEWAIEFDDYRDIHHPNLTDRQQFVLDKVRKMRKLAKHKLEYPPVFQPTNYLK